VTPGDTLRLEVTLEKMRRIIGKGHGVATVNHVVVAEGDLTFAVVDRTS
jgi:3-hydroxyacyl-[acyl-carrier-protein] dehydratase